MPLRLPRFAFAKFEEPVTCEFALPGDARGTVRRFTANVAVVQGRDLSAGAGASVAPETGDRLSAILRPDSWPFPAPPAPGTRNPLRILARPVRRLPFHSRSVFSYCSAI